MNVNNDTMLENSYVIGKFGKMRKSYLQEHDAVTYCELISNNMLVEHLIQFDEMLNRQIKILVKCMMKNNNAQRQLDLNNENEFAKILIKYENNAEEIVIKQHFKQ